MKPNLAISAFIVSTVGKHGGVSAETIRGQGAQRRLPFKSLVFVGEPDTHPGKFPLGRCKGDCDTDDECRDILQCFKRGPTGSGSIAPVPGCVEDGNELLNPGKDYCTQRGREDVGNWLKKVGDNGVREDDGLSMVDHPLGECEGDCDHDYECADDLRCFKREPRSTADVPGCSGGEINDPGEDYCIADDPNGSGEYFLVKVGDNGVREDTGNLMIDEPLGQCEGDCDNDDECQDDEFVRTYCFQRSGNTHVPGCWNVGGDPGEDYCVCRNNECN